MCVHGRVMCRWVVDGCTRCTLCLDLAYPLSHINTLKEKALVICATYFFFQFLFSVIKISEPKMVRIRGGSVIRLSKWLSLRR